MDNKNPSPPYFPLSLQISRRARLELKLPPRFEEHRPTPLFPFRALAGALADRTPGFKGSAGQLNLLGLINKAFRALARSYLSQRQTLIGLDRVEAGSRAADMPELTRVLQNFVSLYPPAALVEEKSVGDFLTGDAGATHRHQTLLELYLLSTQMANPAAFRFVSLFDDGELRLRCPYLDTLRKLDAWLSGHPVPGLLKGSLLELLLAPIKASPDSLEGQLGYIRRSWSAFLPEDLLQDILVAFDILAEENLLRGGGPGEMPVLSFADRYEEYEAFSHDADWMANVVLIAKSVYVWLDQLSRHYGRPISRLSDIPDEELDRLARWGFSSLWLIGLWERSPASQKIKQIRGNPEAEASAYSLYDYRIAWDLGGDEALSNLEERCRRRGIRLASDVVPNHTGIYSRWVKEHPDWFIQLEHPPYPAYRYTGPDLSFDSDISLQIEDGYYDHSDAAVVFRHQDRRSGQVRYIYHGNDGTHMPWNDTAQLNYLLPEVREAMIRTIIGIARRFRVIRFDAAMTLAKKHFQRLWFPQPGGGAGVPSRAEHSMSRADFDRVFPKEFWREVVDRVAAEVPDTLLIAEAFWLMEGYFVRTLGMHRVYNSAFMNMLKTEDNGKYRSVVKNVLEFNPEILKRFVNFMNNPDEATAVEQFGKADKYFGVAVLLATMPGLPMFGHGQVEGLREKYGMEYRRAYWDESPDEGFVHHHEAQIFPLLKKRYLFSGAQDFELFDFFSGGHVNEDVLAYSNRCGEQRALVVYHNRFAETGGWLQHSAAKMVPDGQGGMHSHRSSLAQALGVGDGGRSFLRFRDHRSGLEHLQRCSELREKGLYLQLQGYEYHVFLEFREFEDEDGCWETLHADLGGRPVADLDLEVGKIRFASLHRSLERALDPVSTATLIEGLRAEKKDASLPKTVFAFAERLLPFYGDIAARMRWSGKPALLADHLREELLRLADLLGAKSRKKSEQQALQALRTPLAEAPGTESRRWLSRIVLPYLALHRLSEVDTETASPQTSGECMERFLLDLALPPRQTDGDPDLSAELVNLLIRHQDFWAPESSGDFRRLLHDPRVARYLKVHWHEGAQWFNKERFDTLGYGLFLAAALGFSAEEGRLPSFAAERHQDLKTACRLAATAGYRLDKFLQIV